MLQIIMLAKKFQRIKKIVDGIILLFSTISNIQASNIQIFNIIDI